VKKSLDKDRGIYVEILIRESVGRIWELTQDPALHERWDLRFTHIRYLPRASGDEPQGFQYQTRIGFGLRIRGTGETVGQVTRDNEETTSSLKFASEDPKSLIRSGSGYWRYIPEEEGIRFLTWYDYEVRFGWLGRLVDRFAFRPLLGWATAWSFDRLRLWAERSQTPETSINLAIIHGLARTTLALVWLWHGLIPKLMFPNADEVTMLREAGIGAQWLLLIGVGEVLMGLFVLCTWSRPKVFLINAVLMVLAAVCVAVRSPEYLSAAFNPVTLNLCVLVLCVVGWLASRDLPSARRCLRKKPRG
jgi:hypothetical protein